MQNTKKHIEENHEVFLPIKNLELRKLGGILVWMLLKVDEGLSESSSPRTETDRQSQIVNTFYGNLEKHIRDLAEGQTEMQLRVSDFAAMQNLHENYLNAVVKSKTGKTAKACIAEKMIAAAQNLLLNTQLSNKEISYRLGFVECSHFSAYFKKYTGLTPQGYRQIP